MYYFVKHKPTGALISVRDRQAAEDQAEQNPEFEVVRLWDEGAYKAINEYRALKLAIGDAYSRMATSSDDMDYVFQQKQKCEKWLERMKELLEKYPADILIENYPLG